MPQKNDIVIGPGCPTEVAVNVIGGKWKTLILTYLMTGPKRFNELGRLLPHTSKRMLTVQLRELERDNVIHREVYREVPPKVEYSLTSLGESLRPLLKLMAVWGEKVRTTKVPKSGQY